MPLGPTAVGVARGESNATGQQTQAGRKRRKERGLKTRKTLSCFRSTRLVVLNARAKKISLLARTLHRLHDLRLGQRIPIVVSFRPPSTLCLVDLKSSAAGSLQTRLTRLDCLLASVLDTNKIEP